jgi:hypothetical protein|tara:strand:+ start:6380 stop:6913 length:534 start_codon:yes stop_codon:yes gene_type:complete
MSFYQTPANIFNPIADSGLCEGRVLLPLGSSRVLEDALKSAGVSEIITAPDEFSYLKNEWWNQLPPFDWCVAITQGLGSTLDWVIEPGYELSKRGLIVLDRLTFLEPTRKRQDFLTSKRLTSLIVLNPRPEFRADQKKSKDSVTSAWFVFDKTADLNKGTNIEYAVSWQRPRSFLGK